MKVTVRNNNFEKALSIFKRNSREIVKEVRDRMYYEKPSEKRRRKQRARHKL